MTRFTRHASWIQGTYAGQGEAGSGTPERCGDGDTDLTDGLQGGTATTASDNVQGGFGGVQKGGGSVLWKTGEAAARLSGADSDGDGVDKRSVPFYRRAWGQYGRRGGLHMGA
jgi:hypothetical protein